MRQRTHSNSIDTVILAGGLGTRLRPVVSDRPKVLAMIGDRPFLDILLGALLSFGCKRIILSVGYLGDCVRNYCENHPAADMIYFAEEEYPLGTGGGVKNAESFVKSDDFLVMNGDSWITGGSDLGAFYEFHKKENALVTVALASPRKEKDYGAVFLDKNGKVMRFNEKNNERSGYHFLNAGMYFMKKDIFEHIPRGSFSLETDLFPRLVGNSFYGFAMEGELIDIGTPVRYSAAQEIFKSVDPDKKKPTCGRLI